MIGMKPNQNNASTPVFPILSLRVAIPGLNDKAKREVNDTTNIPMRQMSFKEKEERNQVNQCQLTVSEAKNGH